MNSLLPIFCCYKKKSKIKKNCFRQVTSFLPASTVLFRNGDTVSPTSKSCFKNEMSLKYIKSLALKSGKGSASVTIIKYTGHLIPMEVYT